MKPITWLYRIVTSMPQETEAARDRLNELGRLGWELVWINGNDGSFIFKQPLNPERDRTLDPVPAPVAETPQVIL